MDSTLEQSDILALSKAKPFVLWTQPGYPQMKLHVGDYLCLKTLFSVSLHCLIFTQVCVRLPCDSYFFREREVFLCVFFETKEHEGFISFIYCGSVDDIWSAFICFFALVLLSFLSGTNVS